MLNFHNDITIKEKYLYRVRSHKEADEIIKGIYWENGKGCAVGCTIHGNDHSIYEKELGIPSILAKLEDGIFENLPNERAKEWPEQFLIAINVGADLSSVWPNFAVWLLTDEKYGVFQYAKKEESKKAIQFCADLYKRYKEIILGKWKEYTAAAAAAVDDDDDDDTAAAYADTAASYASYAAYAAYAASYAAASSSVAAASYAAASSSVAAASYAAASSSVASSVASYAASAGAYRQKHRIAQADKLLELLRGCK